MKGCFRLLNKSGGVLMLWSNKTSSNLVGFIQQSQRGAHCDFTFPNFDNYRLESTKQPDKSARLTDDDRRGVGYGIFWIGSGIMTLVAGKQFVRKAVAYKGMSADMIAQAAVECDLSSIPEGKSKTFKWRGKPVFVRHRTRDEIDRVRAVPLKDLRDPEPDENRVKEGKENWLVLIGVCTHLGCVPIAGAGDYGGYFCPCHGSHYDASGRIRSGPAPLNLPLPEYEFITDTVIRVGSNN